MNGYSALTMSSRTTRRKSNKVTVHDVAKEAGVSIATVSYVLNNRGSISAEVRKKVRKAAENLGYRQNRAARAMKIGRSDIIGLVIPNIENPFFATLIQSVLLECQKRDFQVFLVDTEGSHETEKKAIQRLIQQGVDGIVVFPIDDSGLDEFNRSEIPFVVLDRENRDLDVVQAEYSDAGRMLAEHLLDLGHKKFGMIDGSQEISSSRQRSNGFHDAVTSSGKVLWRLEHPFTMSLDPEAKKLLRKNNVTAISCGTDLIAIGVIRFLQESGIDVPGDVSVVGFGDMPFSQVVSPALTTIQMPISRMGIEAVELLLARISSENTSKPRSRVVFGVDLVERASTGKA